MGLLDAVMGNVVLRMTAVFSSTPAAVSRKVETHDPVTDITTTSTLVSEVLTTPPEGYQAHLIDGNAIQVGDRKLIARPDWGALTSPKIGDRIVRGELSGSVVKVSPLNSGDQVIAYELQVRTP